MKKSFLKLYDKALIAGLTAIAGVFAFTACDTKKNVNKKEEVAEKNESEKKSDSIPVFKNPNFKDEGVVVMYGVRQDEYKE